MFAVLNGIGAVASVPLGVDFICDEACLASPLVVASNVEHLHFEIHSWFLASHRSVEPRCVLSQQMLTSKEISSHV